MKKRALGKGLDALLSPIVDIRDDHFDSSEQLLILPVDMIMRSAHQPRINIAPQALQELADSIRSQGVMQPIVVRPLNATGKYEIIAGERRWRATQLAGLHEIPAIVRQASDQVVMCLALIENIQREDLNPLEQARAIHSLIKESKMTHDDVAKALGKSRPSVSNLLRLLELHDNVLKLLESDELSFGHAKVILSLTLDQQTEVANAVVAKGLSVRATEQLVKRKQIASGEHNDNDTDKHATETIDSDIRRLQQDLSQRLGTTVTIQHAKSGKGKLHIIYNSLDELDGILHRIKP